MSATFERRDYAPQWLTSDKTYRAYLKEKNAGKRCRRLAIFDIILVLGFVAASCYYFLKAQGVF